MKKIALYSLAAMFALSFAACDGYEEPNPQPQTNPQEAILDASTVEVTSNVTDTPYVLEALNNDGQNIVLATVDAPSLAEGYKIAPVVEITNNDFARVAEVPAKAELVDGKYQVYVTPDDLQGVYFNNISKGPKAKEIKARILLKAETGEGKNVQTAYIGGTTNYYGPYTLTVQPFPSSFVIEQNYYLLGTINDWSVATAVKFTHSGNDPYDDPVFTLKVDVPASAETDGWWWKIVPESTYVTGDWVGAANGAFGVEENGDEALEGLLVGRTDDEDCGAGNLSVAQAGLYWCNVNTANLSYSVTLINTIGVIGDATPNGWDASTPLTTTDNLIWTGTIAFKGGEFKFRANDGWDINLGGAISDLTQGGDNIASPGEGNYEVTLDLSTLPYSCTLVKK